MNNRLDENWRERERLKQLDEQNKGGNRWKSRRELESPMMDEALNSRGILEWRESSAEAA